MSTVELQAGERIAHRYELVAPYEDPISEYQVAVWRVADTVLGRELRAIIIPQDHPHRAEAIDAARRMGMYEDSSAVAILTVIDDEDMSAVFTEFPPRYRLSDYLLKDQPWPAHVVTAIMGEACSAINHARNRGLRHLQLSLKYMYLTDTGDLVLDGIALLAALNGVATNGLRSDLDRSEARGLLVFFASLLEGEDFPSDPNTHNGYIERASRREDLPDRVQALFSTENEGIGSDSPADILRRIVPWGEISPQDIPTLATAIEEDKKEAHDAQEEARKAESLALKPHWPSVFESATSDEIFTDFPRLPEPDAYSSPLPIAQPVPDEEAHDTPEPPDAIKESTHGSLEEPDDSIQPPTYTLRAEEEKTDENSSEAPATASSVNSSSLSDGKPSVPESAAISRSDHSPSHTLRTTAFNASSVASFSGRKVRASDAVIAIFAVIVLIALIFGAAKLFSPLDPVNTQHPDSAATAAKNEHKETTEHEDSAKKENPTPAPPPQIATVTFVPADQNLANDPEASRLFTDAPKAADADPQTVFQSWYFGTSDISEDSQFGIMLQLKQKTSVSSITVSTLSEGGNIQWRNSSADDPLHGDVVAQGSATANTTLDAKKPIETDTIVVWITKLPVNQSDGKNRITITEISVK